MGREPAVNASHASDTSDASDASDDRPRPLVVCLRLQPFIEWKG
jgi:hypothetical protein